MLMVGVDHVLYKGSVARYRTRSHDPTSVADPHGGWVSYSAPPASVRLVAGLGSSASQVGVVPGRRDGASNIGWRPGHRISARFSASTAEQPEPPFRLILALIVCRAGPIDPRSLDVD
jgi:hypothetical protein